LLSRLERIAIAIALSAMLAAVPAGARAQGGGDAKLLSTFCAGKNIRGSACRNARGYPSGRVCDVKLGEDRHQGRFLAAGRTMLVVRYDSGCEAHATDGGGSVVFEQTGAGFAFRGYQPGYQASDCVTIRRNATQDRLICLTGHIGQGDLESGVAEMVFRDSGGNIKLSYDFLMRAEDSTGAYGANTVTCKQPSKYFSLDRLRAGPRPDTVTVEVAYADHDIVRTACEKGFPRPAEVFGEPAPGEAFVPDGNQKNARFVVDLMTRKAAPEPEAAKAAPR
jgi:hypothetical protein